ncbi:MBL fold metallo-hydrolase [Bacteroides ihuae]|uniref:MBL fold metallo-hydrolase n=1 Tax=Bacteroides ihuae TaxID=1852362 RepID=UPI0008D97C2F|nr:MBL fold metallo-hydrolase [Bacteroides ihuae]
MKHTFLLLAILFIPSLHIKLHAQKEKYNLEVTYIANEGYLLKTDHHKVLIDALFTESYGIFDVPEKDTVDAIMEGTTPFDHIEMHLLTHYHKDHCSPELMVKYLNKFPNIKLVTNRPALVFIDGDQFGFVSYKNQFVELTPEQNRNESKNVNGVYITAHAMKHLSFFRKDIDIEQYMYNVAYTIEMDGVQIFHSGDTSIENMKIYLEQNKDWKPNIDIAFLYYGMLNTEDNLKYIISTLHPKKIVIMHVPLYLTKEWKSKTEELKKSFPELYLLNKSASFKKFVSDH